MRAAVVLLDVLSVLAAAAVELVAIHVGTVGPFAPVPGVPQSALLGAGLIAAPVLVTGVCVWLSIRRMRRGQRGSAAIAAVPLAVALMLLLVL